jgi:hypothetical protein
MTTLSSCTMDLAYSFEIIPFILPTCIVPFCIDIATPELSNQACSFGPPLRKQGGPTAWGPVPKNGSSFHEMVRCSIAA